MIKKKIVIVWEGFPVCGLRALELMKFYSDVVLFGTKPSVPFAELTSKIIDIECYDGLRKFSEELANADLVIITGWSHKNWLRKVVNAKQRNDKLKVCLAVDNNLRMSLRQKVGKYYFKYFINPLADFYFVPGKSSQSLLCYFGVDPGQIFLGYYGAHSSVYYQRNVPKRSGFVFVGQKIKRKGISTIHEAFNIYKNKLDGSQSIQLIGGDRPGDVSGLDKIGMSEVGFLQPNDCAQVFSSAKTLILPSYVEHWGTVVCEAAACGCSLLLSDKVGAAPDLLMEGVNGFQFKAGSSQDLALLMRKMDKLPDVWHHNSAKISVNRASNFDEKSYLSSVLAMLEA